MTAHIPDAIHCLALAIILAALVCGFPFWLAVKRAPRREGWVSSGDERAVAAWERHVAQALEAAE